MEKWICEQAEDCRLCTSCRETIFHLYSFKKGEVHLRKILDRVLLVFILRGELIVNYGVTKSACVKAGQMCLLPKQFGLEYCAQSDGRMLVCHLGPDMQVCNQYSIEHLERYIQQVAEKGQFTFGRKFLCSLTCPPLVRTALQHLIESLEAGVTCLHYQEMKREELFLLFKRLFTPQEIALFFYPLLSKEPDFKDFVYAHFQDIRDVKEFAEMANMSLRTFNRKFKDAFDDTAQNWLLARRAEAILYDICQTTLSFSELSLKYEFSSPSYFSKFCKSQFGKTPAVLRKNWQNGEHLPFVG